MQKVWIAILLIMPFLSGTGHAQQLITPGYQFNSDPTCREINGRFYVFTSHDQSTVNFQGPEDFWHNMYDYHAYSTVDFKKWIDHGSILSIHDAGWATGMSVWDGDAGIAANGRYYAYIPFRSEGFEIGVLVADKPEGPYRDALGKPLMTREILENKGISLIRKNHGKQAGCLSPTVIYDHSGVPYLLFGQWRVFAVKLKPSMTAIEGPVIEIEVPLRAGEAYEYIEGPWIHKMEDRYYFSYMTYKDWQGTDNPNFSDDDPEGPYIQYCTSDNMFGPYRDPGHWIYPFEADAANNQHAVGTYQGEWYVVYHVPYQHKQHRQAAVTRLRTDDNGDLLPIYPARDPGVVPQDSVRLVLDAYAYKREAEEFHSRKDAIEERGLKQDFHFKLKDKGYLHFKNIDFGEGAGGFRIAVSCENCKIEDARVEFRLDRPDGPLIGSAEVGFTYWITHYRELTGKVQGAGGIHDLYIIGRGKHGDAYGRLFNVNWFTFTK